MALPAGRGMALKLDARRGEAAVAAVLVLIGGFFIWQSLALPMGSLALGAQALGLLIGGLAAPRTDAAMEIGHRDVLLVFVAMLLVPVFFERLGAALTLAVFAAAVAMIVGRVRWWKAAIGAVIGIAVAWYFFKTLLGVQLPAGLFS
jgi:hypothetical protein